MNNILKVIKENGFTSYANDTEVFGASKNPNHYELLTQAIMDYYNANERWEPKNFDETGRKVPCNIK